jgi:hypothetical protein
MIVLALQAFLDVGGKDEVLFLCAIGMWVVIYVAIFGQFFKT